MWSLDLRQWTAGSPATASVELLAAVPESGFLNGLSVLCPNTPAIKPGKRVSKPTVLFADTIAGQIYALDIGTNNVRVTSRSFLTAKVLTRFLPWGMICRSFDVPSMCCHDVVFANDLTPDQSSCPGSQLTRVTDSRVLYSSV